MADTGKTNIEEVATFDASKLKKVETKEKQVLPTKEDVAQAKVDEKPEGAAK